MTFLTINAHNCMLDVSCHRNLETTYLKDLEEGGEQVLENDCRNSVSLFSQNSDTQSIDD
jgi:hypothetical protein